MPHAMQNHQATSKKSFRIRSKQEHDLLKMNFSNNAAKSSKDLQEMNEETQKSLYELRKSHAAFVGRPMSS